MSWERIKLSEISINLDNRRKPLNETERNRISKLKLYPYLGANNIMGYIDEYLFDEEIICIAEDGGSWGENQKCCVFITEKCWVNNHAHVLKGNGKADLKFLMYYLNAKDLNSHITGSTRGKLTKSSLDSITIPLPPLATQKRIADILDAADALRQKDQELLKKYDELAQTIFIDMFGDPVKNEKGWGKSCLKEITSKLGSGATPTGGKTAYKKSGISLIRSMNIYDFSFKWKDLAFIDESQSTRLNNVTVLSKDVLFNITGASVCRCSIVPDEVLPARVNQHVAIIRPKSEILNPVFLNHLLVSESIKNKLLGVGAYGGAVMEAITKEQLQEFEIILPPVERQNEFEENINNVFSGKKIKINSLENSKFLFDSLIQKAFKGELI
jgi:type I restriction enzyme S subunit